MSEEINVIRTQHNKENPYFLMARSSAQDNSLSWEARGVLSYLLSKSDDWQVRVKDLQQKCGRDKVKGILKELEAAGYLRVERDQHDEAGQFVPNHYQIYETPFTENPSTVNPLTENPPLTYKRVKPHSTERENTPAQNQDQKHVSTEHIIKQDYADVPFDTRYGIINAWNSSLAAPQTSAAFNEKYARGRENHATAAELHRASYTEAQVEAFVKATMKDLYWRGKTLTLQKVAELLPSWVSANAPKPAQPRPVIIEMSKEEVIRRNNPRRIHYGPDGMADGMYDPLTGETTPFEQEAASGNAVAAR